MTRSGQGAIARSLGGGLSIEFCWVFPARFWLRALGSFFCGVLRVCFTDVPFVVVFGSTGMGGVLRGFAATFRGNGIRRGLPLFFIDGTGFEGWF